MNRFRSLKPARFSHVNLAGLFAFLLLCVVVASWVMIVLLQHKIRHLETEYYQGLQLQEQLNEEWGRLMLEKGHLKAPERIERIARERLNMIEPIEQQVIVMESEASHDR